MSTPPTSRSWRSNDDPAGCVEGIFPVSTGPPYWRHLAADGVLERTFVIMLTARTAEDEVLHALELGATDHLAKPFSIRVLMQKLRQALAEN